jgi:thymidylate kinase
MKTKGKWIVFEGLDKAGKTTLAKILTCQLANAKYLKGICGQSILGRFNRCYPTTIFLILEALFSAFMAIALRKKGFVVFQDRYFASVACHLPITARFPNNIFIWIALKYFPRPDSLVYMTVNKKERIRRMLILGHDNPHEKWLINNPDWIDKREKAYEEYYLRFPNKKIKIDTSGKKFFANL